MKKLFLSLSIFTSSICFAQSEAQQIFFGTASGTNSYTVTITNMTYPTLLNGKEISVSFTNANSGASTLTVINGNGVNYGTKSIYLNGSALSSGDISSTVPLKLQYTTATSKWNLIKASTGGGAGGGGSGTVTSVSAGTNLSITAGSSSVNPTLGTIANPTFSLSVTSPTATHTTSTTSPLLVGGSGSTSTLTIKPSSYVGVTTGSEILFKTGHDGTSEYEVGKIKRSGSTPLWIIGTDISSLARLSVAHTSTTTGVTNASIDANSTFSGTAFGSAIKGSVIGAGQTYYAGNFTGTSTTGSIYGIASAASSSSAGNAYGMYASSSSVGGNATGILATVNGSSNNAVGISVDGSNGTTTSTGINIATLGSPTNKGVNITATGDGLGAGDEAVGLKNNISNAAGNYGIQTYIDNTGSGLTGESNQGNYTSITTDGTTSGNYGSWIDISNNGTGGLSTGLLVNVAGTNATSANTGLYLSVDGGSTNYGIVSPDADGNGFGTATPSATMDIVGTLQYTDGNQVNGRVLTSDASGNATWQNSGKLLHTISTPTTSSTITLTVNYINIVNPAGTIAALTINFPNSPSNNDFVQVTFDQIVTSVTYVAGTGGATIRGQINGVVGGQKRWDYDTGTNTWY